MEKKLEDYLAIKPGDEVIVSRIDKFRRQFRTATVARVTGQRIIILDDTAFCRVGDYMGNVIKPPSSTEQPAYRSLYPATPHNLAQIYREKPDL